MPRLQVLNFLPDQRLNHYFTPLIPIPRLRQLLLRVDSQLHQAACQQYRAYHVHRVIKTVCGLYHLPKDEGQEERAHLPEKVHGAGYRAGVINACARGSC